MSESVTVKGERITLDLLLWRRYGLRGRTLLSAAYEANPGLAGLGVILPQGTTVILPDLPPQSTVPVKRVSLFSRS